MRLFRILLLMMAQAAVISSASAGQTLVEKFYGSTRMQRVKLTKPALI